MNQKNPAGHKIPPLNASSNLVFLLSCSPRCDSHTFQLLKIAENTLKRFSGLNVLLETFTAKKIFPCQDCFYRCAQKGHCWQNDDFKSLAAQWLDADGIIIGTPVYTFGPPSQVYAFFERLQALQKANPSYYMSKKWPQPAGIVAQGGSEYGGVEICAQTLLTLCLKVGCTPISGDMPGFSQGVIGQITDDGLIPERLALGVHRLAMRVGEFMQISSAGRKPDACTLRLLLVHNFNDQTGESLSKTIGAVLRKIKWPNISIEEHVYKIKNRQIGPCLGCTEFCSSEQECLFQDDMQDFRQEWLAADMIYWFFGQGDGSSFSSIRAAFDRMNQVRFETFFSCGYRHMARYLKVSAPFISDVYESDQHDLLFYLRHISLLYQNALLPYWAGHRIEFFPDSTEWESSFSSWSIPPDQESLWQKTLRFAIGLKSGVSTLINVLPKEYYPSAAAFAKVSLDTEGRSHSNS